MIVKDEYTGLGDAGLSPCRQHIFEEFRLNKKESRFGSVDMVDKLIWLVCWVGARENTAKRYDTVYNDGIIDLTESSAWGRGEQLSGKSG